MITLQFIPKHEIEGLSRDKKIGKLLRAVKSEKIVLLEGRLASDEEAELIRKTMEQINEEFTGIELSVINNTNLEAKFLHKLRDKIVNLLLGGGYGFTIIGPAKIVKEIKQDPGKIQLLTEESKKKK